MPEQTSTFSVSDTSIFKQQMLNWAFRFNIFCFLDNCNYNFEKPAFDFLLAAQPVREFLLEEHDALAAIRNSGLALNRWLFGHLSYPNAHNRFDPVDFASGYFFEPAFLIIVRNGEAEIQTNERSPSDIFNEIISTQLLPATRPTVAASIHPRYSRDEYLDIVSGLLEHIQRGDCYEINFCQEFFAENVTTDPIDLYLRLSADSPNPFSALYRHNESYCICASPERFIKRRGDVLTSQPIKGTMKRVPHDLRADIHNRETLEQSAKDRCENVMIVDLVRNDMSRVCIPGSITVKELFGIYSFPQVHQMISTVEGVLTKGVDWIDVLNACFPMGSMTGAPKMRVMELIEEYESVPRGLFSGTIGYIEPSGDFDFNVVIRSLFYNRQSEYISFKAGGGITNMSKAEEEYEESMLKAAAIVKLLSSV